MFRLMVLQVVDQQVNPVIQEVSAVLLRLMVLQVVDQQVNPVIQEVSAVLLRLMVLQVVDQQVNPVMAPQLHEQCCLLTDLLH